MSMLGRLFSRDSAVVAVAVSQGEKRGKWRWFARDVTGRTRSVPGNPRGFDTRAEAAQDALALFPTATIRASAFAGRPGAVGKS